jgi:serine/threonine protein kinase
MCRALAYLHRVVGVCHRDIKPQNILVSFLILLFFLSWGSLTFAYLHHVVGGLIQACRVFAGFIMQMCLFAL